MNAEVRNCQNCKKDFTVEPEDFDFYKKMEVPPPTWCPECRLIRRLAWRNERTFYRRECGLCRKSIITLYGNDEDVVVYCNPCWWSDKWDGLSYGVDFDPQRPFFEQLIDLYRRVPIPALFGLYPTWEQTEIANMGFAFKNCYYVTHSDYLENCSYCSTVTRSKEVIDSYMVDQSESCYESVNCRKCYRTFFSVDCEDCYDTYFSLACVGSSNIFGCVNLKNKQYYIFNKPYTKEEYERRVVDLMPNSHERIVNGLRVRAELMKSLPVRFSHERRNADSSGDYLYNSKNAKYIFVGSDLERAKFCAFVTPGGCSNAYDFTHFGEKTDLLYETLQSGYAQNIRFTWYCIMNSRNVEYGISNLGMVNAFGCVGLRKKEYCILNKQYSKKEFEDLRQKIVDQMNTAPYRDKQGVEYRYGEFFPMELSPFPYNDSTAQLYFPLSETEVRQRGLRWARSSRRDYKITLSAEQMSASADFSDDIGKEVLGCLDKGECQEGCSGAFRLIPDEVTFLKRYNLPLPQYCPSCRHARRVYQTTPFQLWHRQCMCDKKHSHHEGRCANQFETSYAPTRPEIVYCESCYQQEVV